MPRQPDTHCRRGHEHTSENLYVVPSGRKHAGARQCKACVVYRRNAKREERGLGPGTKWVVKDLNGMTFGRLTVVGQYPVRHSHGNARWVVECTCGTVKIVRSTHLIRGTTLSCGCMNTDRQKQRTVDCRSRAMFVAHMETRYRKNAALRGVAWELTTEQVDELLAGNCFYCGVEPLQKNRTQRGNAGFYAYNGIDRMVNYLGYFPDNCVPCCGTCNIAKQDMNLHEFVTWIRRLTANCRIGG